MFLIPRPLIKLPDNFLPCLFRHRPDARRMASVRSNIDLHVLLPFEVGDAHSTPRVGFPIDKDHLRVVLFQIAIDFVIHQGSGKGNVASTFGKHETFQVSGTAFDG